VAVFQKERTPQTYASAAFLFTPNKRISLEIELVANYQF